jgi:hypothetical protein
MRRRRSDSRPTEDGDWFGYVRGDGRVGGDRVSGDLQWTNHPHRRADGTWLPDVQGVITTDDGAAILFSFVGYNRGVTDPFEYERRAGLAALTLLSNDERYRWVNDVFAILEADIRPEAGPERWRIRAFECVNEIASQH